MPASRGAGKSQGAMPRSTRAPPRTLRAPKREIFTTDSSFSRFRSVDRAPYCPNRASSSISTASRLCALWVRRVQRVVGLFDLGCDSWSDWVPRTWRVLHLLVTLCALVDFLYPGLLGASLGCLGLQSKLRTKKKKRVYEKYGRRSAGHAARKKKKRRTK